MVLPFFIGCVVIYSANIHAGQTPLPYFAYDVLLVSGYRVYVTSHHQVTFRDSTDIVTCQSDIDSVVYV